MVHLQPRLLLTLALCPMMLYLLCQRFDPMRPHAQLLTRCLSGTGLLVVWNLLLPLHLGMNPLSAWLAGTLGVPGLGLLAFLRQLT